MQCIILLQLQNTIHCLETILIPKIKLPQSSTQVFSEAPIRVLRVLEISEQAETHLYKYVVVAANPPYLNYPLILQVVAHAVLSTFK